MDLVKKCLSHTTQILLIWLLCGTDSLQWMFTCKWYRYWCVFTCIRYWKFLVCIHLNQYWQFVVCIYLYAELRVCGAFLLVCDTDVFCVWVYLHAVLMSSFVWFYLFVVLMYSFVWVYMYVVLMCLFVHIYLYAVLMCSFVMSDGSVVSAHCQAALSSCCFVGMSIKTRWTLI